MKINFQDVEYTGYIVAPPESAGKKPLVIVIHNFQGLKWFDLWQAEYFARVGYASLAIDLYSEEMAPHDKRLWPDDPKNMPEMLQACFGAMVEVDHDFGRFRALLSTWLDAGLAHPFVDSAFPPAAMGFCFGGVAVMEAVRGGLNLGAAVSLHGILECAWDQNPFKYAGVVRKEVVKCENKYNTKTVLYIENGHHDDLVTPETIKKFIEEMEGAGVDWHFHDHGKGAGHGFALPPSLGPPGCLNESADRRATANMLTLFREVFPGVPQNNVERNAAGTTIPPLVLA